MSDWLDPDRLEQQCRKARALRERFLAGDMGYGKRAQEPCGGPASPSAPPEQQPLFVTGNCGGADAQGAAIVEQDCLERDAPHRVALLRVAKLPDGRGKR